MKHTLAAYEGRRQPRSIRWPELGMLCALMSMMGDGTYNVFAKGLSPFLSPITLLLISEALSAVFVVAVMGLLPLMIMMVKMRRRELIVAVIVGLLNSYIGPLIWYIGLTKTTAVNASILSAASLIYALALSRMFLGERISQRQIYGAMLVMAGVIAVAIGPATGVPALHAGDALILLSGIFFSLGTALFKKYLTHLNPELALFLRNMTGVACVLMLSLFFSHAYIAEMTAFPAGKILLLLAFAFFSRYLSLTCLYCALDRLPVTHVALIGNASPLAGMVFASLILGESIYGYHFIGAALMMAGLLMGELPVAVWKDMANRFVPDSLRRVLPSWQSVAVPVVSKSGR